jgi:hypothetical protein
MTDSSQFHAYTDGTDTIIGTSCDEAVRAYTEENPDASDQGTQWEELGDGQLKTIRDGIGSRETKTNREWIDWHISRNPDNFSRLLCSTEY